MVSLFYLFYLTFLGLPPTSVAWHLILYDYAGLIMGKIALLFAMLFCIPAMTAVSYASEQPQLSKELKAQLIGSPVFIQIFKEERTLELYAKVGNEYRLLDSYRICNFS